MPATPSDRQDRAVIEVDMMLRDPAGHDDERASEMATIPYQTMRQARIPYDRARQAAVVYQRVRQAMNSLLTVIGLGGTSTDTIDSVLERERTPNVQAREQSAGYGPPLTLMMARAFQPNPRAPFDRF
jgi:hypothetical protein